MEGEEIRIFFESLNQKIGRCFYPFNDCPRKPIRAHSIQNSGALDLIHTNNHVYIIRSKFESIDKNILDFRLIGRNEASTFLGLCEEHDGELFAPIDKHSLDSNNQQQLFLLAYRSLLKEYHATFEGFIRIHEGYQKQVTSGYVPGTNMKKEAPYLNFMTKLYELSQYKENFDKSLINEEYTFLTHQSFLVNHKEPSVSCSQLFSADSMEFKDDVLRIILNVIPISNDQTIVIFSTTNEEAILGDFYWNRCFSNNEYFQKYEVSKMIIRNCEIFS